MLDGTIRAIGDRIIFKKQSAHSPELNMLDLGVWSMLASGVRKRWKTKLADPRESVVGG